MSLRGSRPTLDTRPHTGDGEGPQQMFEAWNDLNWTPLAVVIAFMMMLADLSGKVMEGIVSGDLLFQAL